MMIYHEDIIPTMCNYHLGEQWSTAWRIYHSLKKNPAKVTTASREFFNHPLQLAFKIYVIYQEYKKRDIKTPLKPPEPHDIYEQPLFELMREWKTYTPWASRRDQIVEWAKCKGCTSPDKVATHITYRKSVEEGGDNR